MSIVKFKTSWNISLKKNKIFFLFSQIENQRFSTALNNNIDSVGKADQIKISPEVAFGNSQSYEVMLNLTSQKKETHEIASQLRITKVKLNLKN